MRSGDAALRNWHRKVTRRNEGVGQRKRASGLYWTLHPRGRPPKAATGAEIAIWQQVFALDVAVVCDKVLRISLGIGSRQGRIEHCPSCLMGCVYFIIAAILLALAGAFIENNPGISTAIFVAIVVVGVTSYAAATKQADQEEREKRQRQAKARQAFNAARAAACVPDSAIILDYRKGDLHPLQLGQLHAWIEADALCLFPSCAPADDSVRSLQGLVLSCIPIERIDYFAAKGDVVHETRITGGGGGGSSIAGAVVGGAIAGGAGAIIGSRNPTAPIRSEMVTHDNRETILYFQGEGHKRCSMVFGPDNYDQLDKLLPEKAYAVVNAVKTNRLVSRAMATQSVADEIRELAKLRDEGLLTEEEFAEQKLSILKRS